MNALRENYAFNFYQLNCSGLARKVNTCSVEWLVELMFILSDFNIWLYAGFINKVFFFSFCCTKKGKRKAQHTEKRNNKTEIFATRIYCNVFGKLFMPNDLSKSVRVRVWVFFLFLYATYIFTLYIHILSV